mmetsp:Transcript_35401/g.40203  ORF Transcript_35401/g.40203 Transcript_35401/m.40203 type:complete len:117 (+) Transcript_35401:37-387(+)
METGTTLQSNTQTVSELFDQAMVLFNQDKDAEALVLYDRILGIDPNHSRSHSCKGRIYTAAGMHRRAIECCEKAIEMDPNNSEGHYGKGEESKTNPTDIFPKQTFMPKMQEMHSAP